MSSGDQSIGIVRKRNAIIEKVELLLKSALT